ncbi:RNA-directed DNA polymerase, eukaryota, reverse transcriptase zinc-binding domain protein, partial [Tanacetum coccineum]
MEYYWRGDVCRAVKDFFQNGKFLKEVNATVISLVPKVATPAKVSDYRPIACCNVVYKIISKVICNRIKGALNDLVDVNQRAFIPSKQISDNILLSQELMRNYHKNVDIAMREFRDCVDVMEMSDVQCTGLQFTWNQKPQGGIGVLKKLDRIMANDDFRDQFRGAHAIFKPYRVSDHSPAVLCIPSLSRPKPKPFKLFNVVTSHEKFLDVVKAEWSKYISGFHMYRVVKKLKNLKSPLRKLLYDKGNLHVNVNRLRADLDAI